MHMFLNIPLRKINVRERKKSIQLFLFIEIYNSKTVNLVPTKLEIINLGFAFISMI